VIKGHLDLPVDFLSAVVEEGGGGGAGVSMVVAGHYLWGGIFSHLRILPGLWSKDCKRERRAALRDLEDSFLMPGVSKI